MAIAGSGGGSQGSAVSIRRPMSQPAIALIANTTVSLTSALNRPSATELLTERLKMRRPQANATVYLQRHAGDPFGADQVFDPLGDFGARTDAS